MSVNGDIEMNSQDMLQNNIFQQKSFPNNYSSPSPPRPGFPHRVVYDQHVNSKSPNDLHKPFSYDDQKGIPAYTTTSTLIPTTLINANAYDISQESKAIREDPENIVADSSSIPTQKNDTVELKPSQYEHVPTEDANIFQVTSPTEENIPTSTFDYLYEFSETRKVLEEFFKCPDTDKAKELEKFSDFNESDDSLVSAFKFCSRLQ